jgi:hypothetical protein
MSSQDSRAKNALGFDCISLGTTLDDWIRIPPVFFSGRSLGSPGEHGAPLEEGKELAEVAPNLQRRGKPRWSGCLQPKRLTRIVGHENRT